MPYRLVVKTIFGTDCLELAGLEFLSNQLFTIDLQGLSSIIDIQRIPV